MWALRASSLVAPVLTSALAPPQGVGGLNARGTVFMSRLSNRMHNARSSVGVRRPGLRDPDVRWEVLAARQAARDTAAEYTDRE